MMRFIMRITLIFILLINVNCLLSQNSKKDKISFLYNGGINFSKKIITDFYSVYDNEETPETNYRVGTKHGVGIQYDLLENLSLVLGVNYTRVNLHEMNKSIDIQTELIENQDWLSIPVSCKLYFFKSKLKPYIRTGFDFSYLLNTSGEITREFINNPSFSPETYIVSYNPSYPFYCPSCSLY